MYSNYGREPDGITYFRGNEHPRMMSNDLQTSSGSLSAFLRKPPDVPSSGFSSNQNDQDDRPKQIINYGLGGGQPVARRSMPQYLDEKPDYGTSGGFRSLGRMVAPPPPSFGSIPSYLYVPPAAAKCPAPTTPAPAPAKCAAAAPKRKKVCKAKKPRRKPQEEEEEESSEEEPEPSTALTIAAPLPTQSTLPGASTAGMGASFFGSYNGAITPKPLFDLAGGPSSLRNPIGQLQPTVAGSAAGAMTPYGGAGGQGGMGSAYASLYGGPGAGFAQAAAQQPTPAAAVAAQAQSIQQKMQAIQQQMQGPQTQSPIMQQAALQQYMMLQQQLQQLAATVGGPPTPAVEKGPPLFPDQNAFGGGGGGQGTISVASNPNYSQVATGILTSTATTGTTTLAMTTPPGAQIGMFAVISNGVNTETKRIVGMGSLIVDSPIQYNYPVGTPVGIYAPAAVATVSPASSGVPAYCSVLCSQTCSNGYKASPNYSKECDCNYLECTQISSGGSSGGGSGGGTDNSGNIIQNPTQPPVNNLPICTYSFQPNGACNSTTQTQKWSLQLNTGMKPGVTCQVPSTGPPQSEMVINCSAGPDTGNTTTPGSWGGTTTPAGSWGGTTTPSGGTTTPSGGTTAPAFNPSVNVVGCILWLDATDQSTLTKSGQSITAWNDKSAQKNNFTNPVQSSSATPPAGGSTPTPQPPAYPKLNTSLNINGNAVVDFTNNSYLYNTNIPFTSAYTIFVVGYTSDPKAPSSYRTPYIITNYNNLDLFTGINTVATNTVLVLGVYHDVLDYWNGYIGEVLVFNNTLSLFDCCRIESYLTSKWGIKPTGETSCGRTPPPSSGSTTRAGASTGSTTRGA